MAQVRRSWLVVAGVAVVLLIALFAAQHLLNADTYRGQIEAYLSRSLGRSVQLGHVSFSLFTGSLVATDPTVADDPRFETQPFLTAKDIRIRIEVGAYLFHHELHIEGFTLENPKITLLRAANGEWNYSSLGSQHAPASVPEGANLQPASYSPPLMRQIAAAAPSGSGMLPGLTVAHLAIRNGTVTVARVPEAGTPHVYTDVNITARNFAMSKVFPFTVNGKLPDGGTVVVQGTAGPIDQRDASLTPVTAQVSLQHADLVAAGFVQGQQGIAGMADLDAKIVSNGQTAQADGTLHLTQLKLAANGTPSSQPAEVKFSLTQDLQGLSGKIDSAVVQVGHAAMNVSGTYQTTGNATVLALQASGQKMPVDDLVAFLPSLGVQLPSGSRLEGGELTATLSISGPTSAPVISGPVRLTGAQLAGFDLGQKLSSIQALMGAKTGGNTVIQVLDTNLHYGPDGTRTDNLAVVVGGLGSASGNGTVTPGGGLNYRLLVKPDAAGVAGIATQALGMLPGVFGQAIGRTTQNGIPVSITGTTANPVFHPELGRMFGATPQAAQPGQPANPLGTVLGGLLGH